MKRCLAFLALGAAVALAACRREEPRPNVLLVTIDTWRADRLSPELTPNLWRLASEGLRFTHASTPRAKTTPAIASLMSGQYPHEHGVRELLQHVAPSTPLLADRLHAAGWRTCAAIGNYVLKDELSGLARGFDRWIEELPDRTGVPPDDVPQCRATRLVDEAEALLDPATHDGATREPWFAWLHFMDPHGTYDPPAELRPPPRAPEWMPDASASGSKRWIAEYNVPADARGADGRIDVGRVRDLYDGEVRYADREIGRLLERLRASGALARTIVVVTADHGESLGEQDYWFEHGRNASEATCHVPLVIRLPDAWPERPAAGTREVGVSLVDVAPTIAELVSVAWPTPDDHAPRGRSFVAALAQDPRVEHAVFGEKVDANEIEGALQTKTVRVGEWKLVRRFARQGRALVAAGDQIYDLSRDPFETREVHDDPRAPVERLRAELLRFTAADARFPEVANELRRARESAAPDVRRVLEGLGY